MNLQAAERQAGWMDRDEGWWGFIISFVSTTVGAFLHGMHQNLHGRPLNQLCLSLFHIAASAVADVTHSRASSAADAQERSRQLHKAALSNGHTQLKAR